MEENNKPIENEDYDTIEPIRKKQNAGYRREPEQPKQAGVKFKADLGIEKLIPFENHPFKLYEGQLLFDMTESIRKNGVMTPITVRPSADKDKYEILSGHNRVAAAKEARLLTIPAIVREGLTDDEALFIVTETNLIQRSFGDLSCSERAIALATHYEVMKKTPGYRSDLIKEVEELTCAPVGSRMRTRDKLGQQYGLSKNTVARYLRINKLIPELKEQLDSDGIGMRVAESLSYLRTGEQEIVASLIADSIKISIKQAANLKDESEKAELDEASIKKILELTMISSAKIKPIKLSEKILSKYFDERQSSEEIERAVSEALEQYFSNRKS